MIWNATLLSFYLVLHEEGPRTELLLAAGPLYPQDPGQPLEEDGSDPRRHLAVTGVAPVVKVEDGDGDRRGGGDDDHDAREVDADEGGGGGGRLHRRYLEERKEGVYTELLHASMEPSPLHCHDPSCAPSSASHT